MKIPNGKKYLLYIKTPKTAGTSFLDLLKKIKNVKVFKRVCNQRLLENIFINDIIVVFSDNLQIFKNKYSEIYNDSYKIIISRNPYSKFISAFNYHPLCKKLTLNQILLENFDNFDSSKIDYKLKVPKKVWNLFSMYNHVLLPQTNELIINNKCDTDKILKFENINEDIKLFLQEFEIKNIELEHYNKTIYTKKIILEDKYKNIIKEKFYNDFIYLNYEF